MVKSSRNKKPPALCSRGPGTTTITRMRHTARALCHAQAYPNLPATRNPARHKEFSPMASTEPELLAHLPSDNLRKLRAQMVAGGDITDRLSAAVNLLSALVDKELVHEARLDRDKKATEAQLKAQEASAKRAASDEDEEVPHPAPAGGRSGAGVTARR